MAEEAVSKTDIVSIDPESIINLLEYRDNAIDAFVYFYSKNFDKIFAKIAESLNGDEEKSKKFKDIRDKHINGYRLYIENRLERRMRQLFEDNSIAKKLVYISDNYQRFPDDLIAVYTAMDPIRKKFIEELTSFEQSLDQRLESKTKTLEELTENLTKTQESYESLRKSVQKDVLTIIKQLDSIEVQDLDLSPKTN